MSLPLSGKTPAISIALLLAVAVLPSRADEGRVMRSVRVAELLQPDRPSDVAGEQTQESRTIVKLGTSRETVESLLGRPVSESLIPSLRRVLAVYPDATKFLYLDGRLISFAPGANVRQLSGGSFVIKQDDTTVILDAAGLHECGMLVADELDKCLIEHSPRFLEPGAMPTAYGDFPFGPPHVYWPPPWPVHAERVMPLRLHRYERRSQYIYYRPYRGYLPSPYVVPSHR